MTVHVCYKSLYLSLPSSAKQQREMTNSALSEEREVRQLIFKIHFLIDVVFGVAVVASCC